jgi:bifunctional non-homologous end joining protein LigD
MLLPISGGRAAAEETGVAHAVSASSRQQRSTPSGRVTRRETLSPSAQAILNFALPRPGQYLTPVEVLEYLAREWESYGTIDATNMRHVAWALEAERKRLEAQPTEAATPRALPRTVSPFAAQRDSDIGAEPPFWIEPQRCKPVDKAPDGTDWVHELLFEGERMAARIDHGRVELLTGSGMDRSERHPETVAALAKLPVNTAYIDGVLCDADQTSAVDPGSSVYYAFDLIERDGAPVRRMGLLERKKWLAALLENPPTGVVYCDHDADEETLRDAAWRRGFAGTVSKRIDAAYAPGNRGLWVRSKLPFERAESA